MFSSFSMILSFLIGLACCMPCAGFPPPKFTYRQPYRNVSNRIDIVRAKGDFKRLVSVLQPVLDRKAKQWNSSAISVAVAADGGVAEVVSGYADWKGSKNATASHVFAMGSVQKMYTASAVMLLVEKGIIDLNDTISQHVDPYLQKHNDTTLLALFGSTVLQVTVYHLLSMRSGMHDFDKASARAYQLANPAYDVTPFDILHLCQKDFACNPGECGLYSSTGYVVLGFLLAYHAGMRWDETAVPSYEANVLPRPSLVGSNFAATQWAIHGTLAKYATKTNPVAHGYQPDTGDWPWPFGGDVYNVSALGGWTCGNLIATAADCASFARALYGPIPKIVSADSVRKMTRLASLGPGSWDYGMGTMALPGSRPGSLYYGHGGATYGFLSYVGYNVNKDFALAIVTNLELAPWQMYQNLNDIHAELYPLVEAAFATVSNFPPIVL